MILAAAVLQSDPAIADQLHRLVTTQILIAIALGIVCLALFGVAVGTLLAIRKVLKAAAPLLDTVNRIGSDAQDITDSAKARVTAVLGTVEDLNLRLRAGVEAVEDRVRQFGTVVDVVQSEAEDMLLDAASTARGVHTASHVLRSGGRHGPRARSEDEQEYTEE